MEIIRIGQQYLFKQNYINLHTAYFVLLSTFSQNIRLDDKAPNTWHNKIQTLIFGIPRQSISKQIIKTNINHTSTRCILRDSIQSLLFCLFYLFIYFIYFIYFKQQIVTLTQSLLQIPVIYYICQSLNKIYQNPFYTILSYTILYTTNINSLLTIYSQPQIIVLNNFTFSNSSTSINLQHHNHNIHIGTHLQTHFKLSSIKFMNFLFAEKLLQRMAVPTLTHLVMLKYIKLNQIIVYYSILYYNIIQYIIIQFRNLMNKGLKGACDRCSSDFINTICLTCSISLCVDCCISHSQSNPIHKIKNVFESAQIISTKAKQLVGLLSIKQKQQRIRGNCVKEVPLQTSNFEKHLNQMEFVKKQVIQTIQRYFSELSLEFINMWEIYLLRFSTGAALIQRIQQLIRWLKPYTELIDSQQLVKLTKHFLGQNFEERVDEILKLSVDKKIDEVPQPPRLNINERILSELQYSISKCISCQNYKFLQTKKSLDIQIQSTIDENVTSIPIFPFKTSFYYLYNIRNNSYEVVKRTQSDIPAFPKGILLPNGNFHIIGGINQKGHLVKSHIKYQNRKLTLMPPLPTAKNPYNSLIYNQGKIYMIGGLKGKNQWDNQCSFFNVKDNFWKSIPSMKYSKPHQSVSLINSQIIAFGLPSNSDFSVSNIQIFSLQHETWKVVQLSNLLCNPFLFSAGFSTIQINSNDILFFGGKRYQDSLKGNKFSTDRSVCDKMYIFCIQNNSFSQIEKQNLNTGIQFGEINAMIVNSKVISVQYLLSKVNPITRWFNAIQVVQISEDGQNESTSLLTRWE